MQVNLDNPTPGSFTDQVFDLVIAGTEITSEKVQAALRDHFVNGVDRKEAYEANEVAAPAFSVRYKRFMAEVDRLRQVIDLCAPKPAHEALVEALHDVEALAKKLQIKAGDARDMAKGKSPAPR